MYVHNGSVNKKNVCSCESIYANLRIIFGFLARPMLVVAGGCDQDQIGMGAFQEWPQVSRTLTSCVCMCVCIDCTRNGLATPRTLYIHDVIGHPPYGHGAREIGGSHE